MSRDMNNDNSQQAKNKKNNGFFNRRDILAGLATLPVLGIFFQKLYVKRSKDNLRKKLLFSELGLSDEAPTILPSSTIKSSGKELRLGLIGYGSRGEYLMRAAGFAHSTWLESMQNAAKENKMD
ncbi:MAG: gfo/Idh/MocA family oxidoreductase, partial [Candidatus Latescibacteria bacterium]|nr:gfo/Idh/MocA family oxidoreductase [Candidatus Latescibacterota bacterium]